MDPSPDRRAMHEEAQRVAKRVVDMLSDEFFDLGGEKTRNDFQASVHSRMYQSLVSREQDNWREASFAGAAFLNYMKETETSLSVLAWAFPDNNDYIFLTDINVFLPRVLIDRFQEVTGLKIQLEDSPIHLGSTERTSFKSQVSLSYASIGEVLMPRIIPADLR